ncbi:serine/threonine-protein kinase [Nonomuraea montanisoli]|uniref:serine/threonine-protein kinase n=1 Tax=Nonomuraea montanisoli TaxID=2741721 RepID=UPI002E2D8D9B|nr:PASTA domain-containing protein [Nonomuraea montanisoli]
MPTAQPLRTGDPRRLGSYELTGRLGEGGQGVVFLGSRGEETYAVKLLHGPVGDERAAFLREVELAKHVARFCTAQVIEAGFDEGRPYIVSEYVDGPSLQRHVVLTGPRGGAALERLAVSTATALAAIHRAGIVHRDFKPQNVLLGVDGPRVIDFGLARALDAAATVSGRGVGTPAYMAPEQITASAVTGAADVFSWGATMCFAANAVAPFGQDSVAPVLHRILTAPPELGRLDGRLRDIVAACLDKDARNRPSSRELLLELLGDAEGVPAEVLRSPPPHILRTPPPAPDPAVPAGEGFPSGEGEDFPSSPVAYALAGSSPLGPAPLTPGSVSPGLSAGAPLAQPEATGAPYGYVLPEATGAPHGYALPEDGSFRAGRPPEGGPWASGAVHPATYGSPLGTGPVPGETEQTRHVGQAFNRAGLAVSAALLVSAAVLVTVVVPAFRHGGSDPAAARPTVITSAPAGTMPDAAHATPHRERHSTGAQQPAGDPATAPAADPPARVPAGIQVPSLTGLDRGVAVKALERAGLVPGTVTQVDSPRKVGQVLGTQPQAGAAVPKGTAVALRVSAGLVVPAVTGMRRGAAETAVTSAGLALGAVTTSCSARPDGQVLSSSPQAGTRVAGGGRVALVVSRHGTKMPGVLGRTGEGASGTLRTAGFTVTQETRLVTDEARAGTVLAQSVAAGACAKPGTGVVLTVGVLAQSDPDPTEPSEPPATESPTPTSTTTERPA